MARIYGTSKWAEEGSFKDDILHSYNDIVDAIKNAPWGKDVRGAMAQMLIFLYSTIQTMGDNFSIDMSPTDTFATLEKLEEKYPTGQQGVFVVQDTGHWYFWDELNSQWKDGGPYQSAGYGPDLQAIVDHTVKAKSEVVDASNFDRLLSDLDNVEKNSMYQLTFEPGTTALPLNLPFKKWPDYFKNGGLIVFEKPHSQLFIVGDKTWVRYRTQEHAWTDWYNLNGFSTSETTVTAGDFSSFDDLPVGKLYAVDNVGASKIANAPVNSAFSIITYSPRISDYTGASQVAYDRDGKFYLRSKNAQNIWSDWETLTFASVINAFRENIFYDYETRNVIWQRRNSLNVVMDKWLDNQNQVQPYSGWCYTDYFIPVRPNHDYTFIAKDSGHIDYKVVGVSSVYINLYDEKLNYIAQTNTLGDGTFNTQNAHYIKLSMSYKTYADRQYLSLILGKDKPAKLDAIENTTYSDSALYANGSASYDLVPNTTIYKLDSLPLRLYTDSMTRWSIDKPEIYLYDNRKNEVVYDSVTQSYLLPAKPRTALSAFDNTFHAIKGRATNSYWKFDATTLDKYTIIRQRDIPSSFGDGQNLNVMFIGDSLTNAGVYVNRVGELANTDEHTTINLLGTRGDTYKHEGRGGWSAKIYCTESIFNTYENPFLNLNGKFDFSYYAAKNNITKLDILFLNLGTNDVNYTDIESDPNFDEGLTRYKEILSSIKSTFPDVKIVLGSTITPARYKGANLHVKTRRQEWNDRILSLCLSEGYTYAPYSLIIDPVNDFKYKEENLDDYNTTTTKRVADNTHPADSGYKKMGDLSYGIIKKLAEDIKTGN